MKILYGIQTTGNGHINRSLKIIDELRRLNNEVDILISGNGSDLKILYTFKFKGLKLYYKNGSTNIFKTIFKNNILNLIKEVLSIKKRYDLIITDFEPVSALYGTLFNIKSINISNQASLISNRIKINRFYRLFFKYFCYTNHSIGYFYEKLDKNIYLPIIDQKIIDSVSTTLDHIVVYLPNIDTKDIVDVLNKSNHIFYIFTEQNFISDSKNIIIEKIDKSKFQEKLISSNGVITHSGFSTTTEALYLNKKIWSIPIKSQIEQKINSDYLKKLGVFTEDLNHTNLIDWLDSHPVNWKWSDPTKEIIEKIYGEN